MLPLILFGVALMQTSPYLEMPPEQLVKRIPELKALQSAQDQQMLPAILSKSGARVSDFLNQLVDLTAHEEITQEILDQSGRTKSSRQQKYSYLILLHQSDLSPTPEEYRTDAKGNRVAPGGLDQGYTVTSGFAFECLHFLPGNQSSSTFRYLGTEAVGARNYYVVAFAERPQGKTTNFVDVGGLEIPTVVQGIAWIDQESSRSSACGPILSSLFLSLRCCRIRAAAGDLFSRRRRSHTRKVDFWVLRPPYGCPAK